MRLLFVKPTGILKKVFQNLNLNTVRSKAEGLFVGLK